MRYSSTREVHLQRIIADEADWPEFEHLVAAICARFDARVIEQLDGPDERYWDLVADQKVTLHFQHYLGISLLAPSARDESLVRRIGQIVEMKIRRLCE